MNTVHSNIWKILWYRPINHLRATFRQVTSITVGVKLYLSQSFRVISFYNVLQAKTINVIEKWSTNKLPPRFLTWPANHSTFNLSDPSQKYFFLSSLRRDHAPKTRPNPIKKDWWPVKYRGRIWNRNFTSEVIAGHFSNSVILSTMSNEKLASIWRVYRGV